MRMVRWKSIRAVEPDRDYVAFYADIPLDSYGALIRLLLLARRVFRQLGAARGLVGYSAVVQLRRKQFRTLSVWESEQALRDFACEGPHLIAMASLQSEVCPTRFLRWTMKGRSYPPLWQEACSRADVPVHTWTTPSTA